MAKHQVGIALARWFFVLLLALSGCAKLFDLIGFFAVVATFDVLPGAMIPAFALGLALVELGLAFWLACPSRINTTHEPQIAKLLQTPALYVLLLHSIYFAWLALAYARGLAVPNCGCFGVYWPRPLTEVTLIEDTLLIVVAALWLFGCIQNVRNERFNML